VVTVPRIQLHARPALSLRAKNLSREANSWLDRKGRGDLDRAGWAEMPLDGGGLNLLDQPGIEGRLDISLLADEAFTGH
jgi:hypothetical protein